MFTAVYRVLYQIILNAKLTGRKNLGRKRCTSNRGWPQAWEYSQAKLIQTLGRASQGVDWSWSQCIKSHHAQTSSGKGLPSHFWTRDNVRSILPGLWRKITGLLLSGPKSSFQMKVHFAFHLEIKVPESGGRVERHKRLGTCPHCQRYQKLVQLPWCYCVDWPANSPDLNPIENLWGIVKRKMRDTRPNNADDLKATVKETWASIPPQQCHKLITSMPRRIEAVIKAKGAPTKYWVHIQ